MFKTKDCMIDIDPMNSEIQLLLIGKLQEI